MTVLSSYFIPKYLIYIFLNSHIKRQTGGLMFHDVIISIITHSISEKWLIILICCNVVNLVTQNAELNIR